MNEPKRCSVVPTRMERISFTSGWFVTRWRVTDLSDRDVLQPWFKSEGEAKKIAKQLGYIVV